MEQRHGIHAGDVETSLMLAGTPRYWCTMDRAAPGGRRDRRRWREDFKWLSAFRPVGFGWMTQDLHASGAVGDATLATAEKGELALTHGARAFVELLHDVKRFDLGRLSRRPDKNS